MSIPAIARSCLPFLPANRDATILDLGCGPGSLIDFLHRSGYRRVYGFDVDAGELASASPGATAVVSVGTSATQFLRETAGKWDLVVMREMLYYLDEAAALTLLRELKSRMNPDAAVLVEVFNGACTTASFNLFKDHGIRQVFTERSLRILVERAGFEVISLEGIRPKITGVRSFLFFFASRIWQAWLRVQYWLERGSDANNPRILEKSLLLRARARRG